MDFTDTHCHIQEPMSAFGPRVAASYEKLGRPSADELIARAADDGVSRLIVVGTSVADSIRAVEFVQARPNVWASIGIHPHDTKTYTNDDLRLEEFSQLAGRSKVIALGECGLDYFYNNSSKDDQVRLLHFQLRLAVKHNLPVIFHVREAFSDFWPIFDSYPELRGRGIIHSFSATERELTEILHRDLYIGLNGITTFTTDASQLAAVRAVPLNKLMLETDAPFLTPTPYRGTMCEPKHVRVTAEFLATLRGESLEKIAKQTTENARRVFMLN